ncbi:hypothetical protein DM02DRAFT_545295, partial [Periconia macrospinosa]
MEISQLLNPGVTPRRRPLSELRQSKVNQRSQLTRDQRLQIQTLRRAGFTLNQIAQQLSVSYHQAQYAAVADRPTPKKRAGRPPVLTEEQTDEIELFVVSSRTNRPMNNLTLSLHPRFARWGVSAEAIQHALER